MRKKLKAGLTIRILVDSSTLIALSKIGELDILKKVFGNITITNAIEKEVLTGDFPETEALKVAMGAWIEVIDYEGDTGELRKYGLGRGEASLLLAAKQEDRLVLDETNARQYARVPGISIHRIDWFARCCGEKWTVDKRTGGRRSEWIGEG